MEGPLKGITVLELAGLAPVPFCGMILADFGANVIRIDRYATPNVDLLGRGKRSVSVNLKSPEGVSVVMNMIEKADVLIEPFRPGVAEKLGIGPEDACRINPKLIYARLTGFGQTGPYAKMAGHDINYIALSGALSIMGRKDENPLYPVNLLGDFAGGGLICAMGIVMAIYERTKSGKGQVIDTAMMDGAAYLTTFIYRMFSRGMWGPRGTNFIDTASPSYEVYKTKDDKYMAVGALEPQFYAELLKGLGIHPSSVGPQDDKQRWPETKEKFAKVFASKTREEWCKIFDGTDACVTPVLDMAEVMKHPHAKARNLLLREPPDQTTPLDPAPSPRLSRTPGISKVGNSPQTGEHTLLILKDFGYKDDKLTELQEKGVIWDADPLNQKSKL